MSQDFFIKSVFFLVLLYVFVFIVIVFVVND